MEVSELPSGFEEVRRTDQRLELTKADLPWLPEEKTAIPLVRIRLEGGNEFYLGSAIKEKRLRIAANQLDQHRSQLTNSLLYSHVPDLVIRGHNPYIRIVNNARSERPIYYVGNRGGQRVYFARFDKLQGIPVIIRIAVCDKNMEEVVLSVITIASHKRIKQSSKL